jgi:hypothetical protein
MRRHLVLFSLLFAVLVLVSARHVRADGITDNFTYSEPLGGEEEVGLITVTWQLPASPTVTGYVTGEGFEIDDVTTTVTISGPDPEQYSVPGDSFTFVNGGYTADIEGFDLSGGFVEEYLPILAQNFFEPGPPPIGTGPQLYSGPENAPTFVPGVYILGDYQTYEYGTLVIDELPSTSTPTPEPSSLVLLGAGLLTIGGFSRRKLTRFYTACVG